MKKVLLSASALLFAAVSFAQDPCENTGFSTLGFYEDFSTSTPIGDENGGIYVWGDKDAATSTDGYGVSSVRDTVNMELDMLITQAGGAYTPTGIGFGDTEGDGSGDAYTIDLSNDANVALTITNGGDSTIKVRILLQDVNQNDIDSKPNALLGYDELYEISVGPNSTGTYTGDHAGGKKAVYAPGFTGYDSLSFDMSKVKAIMLTVINGNAPESNNYAPFPLVDYPVSIAKVKVGACPDPVGLSSAKGASYDVYPNPASENVNFSQELNNVTVFDALGNVVATSSKSSDLNVSDYNTGIYFIKSNEGTTQFIVK